MHTVSSKKMLKIPLSNMPKVLLIAVLLLIALFMTLRLPIYPDEIAYRILLERFFQSGGYKSSITPYCIEGFQVAPPRLLMFSAMVWSFLGEINSAIAYRVIPISLLILSLGSLYWFSWQYKLRSKSWFLLLFLPGVTIYGLVILRPEIFIVSSIVMLMISGLYVTKTDKLNILLSVAVLVTVQFILVCFVHPKALYLILPTLITLVLIFEKVLLSTVRATLIVIFIASVLLATYDALEIHRLGYASCNDFPEIQRAMNSLNVNVFDFFKDRSKFISNLLIANDSVRFDRTLSQLAFKSGYDIGVLPDVNSNDFSRNILNSTIKTTVLATFAYVLLIIISIGVETLQKRHVERSFIVYLGVSLAVGCQFFFNIPKNWYDISLSVFSLGTLAFVGSGLFQAQSDVVIVEITNSLARILQPLIAITIIFSLYFNYNFIYKKYVNGYVGPGISTELSINKFNEFIKNKFPLDYVNKSQPIIIDDLTYHTFSNRARAYPITYLMLNARNNPGTIDIVLSGETLIGVTRCSLWAGFDSIKTTTLLERVTFISNLNNPIEICKWVVR